ncbi:hypothetical protein [Streptomyces xanthophaeus]|uniref:hypothetical protein n=1 Tax=Streptomyces xanthophaeus TaxID=67385 RepID=UPI002648DBBE|nr:hypothetical protein [Streptomyces xanthophaeus]WKD36529.1 hypothetical protein KO717_34415 [Streptomyces xanthophaeus]
MTEPIRRGAAPSRSRRDRAVALSIAGAVIIGVGGFLAGRAADADVKDERPQDCATTRAAGEDAVRAATSASPSPGRPSAGTGEWWDVPIPASTPTPDRLKLREYVHLVLQNPGCFTVQERAQAQVLLDQLNSAG